MTEETCKCGAPWPCFCGASKPYVEKDVTATDSEQVVTPMDYLRSEAERLPSGTAAKVLALVTNVPFDSKTHDFGSDAASNDYKRNDTVTLTISREDAESWANHVMGLPEPTAGAGWRIADACRAALEAQHEYDNSPELQALLRRTALEGER